MKKALNLALVLGIIVFLGIKIRNHFFIPDLPLGQTQLLNEAGTELNIRNLEQPYLLISYVQSWCGDCIRESPSIQALQQKAGSNKLAVLLISDESPEKIKRFRQLSKTDLTVYRSSASMEELGIRVFPTTWLLGPDRKILQAKLEGYDWNSAEVHNLIKD